MNDPALQADYLVKGAGAAGMAFVDSLLTDTEATVVMVDRHDRPGGHWNDAYPFVRLHQPSASYGVNSRPLGSGQKDQAGHNRGMYELASGHEVLTHFDHAMQQRFLPSGRVTYLPMSDLDDDGVATSLISGRSRQVEATTVVDATHSQMKVPSTTPPGYTVDPAVTCVPVNALPTAAAGHAGYVVVGGGKTSMDAIIWLLDNGVDPDTVRWIVPRDSWLLDRENLQPGPDFFARFCKSLADQVQSVAEAESIDDVFVRLEAAGEILRIDPSVTPGAYHCATVSRDELAQLRRIQNVVRMGRVSSIEADQILLEHGSIPTDASILHIDCSAAGIPYVPTTPVFEPGRITIQWIRTCQPTFSAAFVGHIEATFDDLDEKNRICTPISPPTEPRDWLRTLRQELLNRKCWSKYPELTDWLAGARLDPFTELAQKQLGSDAEAAAEIGRYVTNVGRASERLDELLS